jgi:hypothetical protein
MLRPMRFHAVAAGVHPHWVGASFHGGVDEPLQVEVAAEIAAGIAGRLSCHDGAAAE